MSYPLLAAVDLGSNSFRLEIGRVEGEQIYPLDTWKDTLRFAAGLDQDDNLQSEARDLALQCLQRFGERLRGLAPQAVRVVATNTLRVAKNAGDFLPEAEAALGFPIEIISGREEARLIYLGVSHTLPYSQEPRLVVDIGGGSTEFIVGRGFSAEQVESLKLGCVGYSLHYFPKGEITRSSLRKAIVAARSEVEEIVDRFASPNWTIAFGSSGTARALADILEQNAWSKEGITPEGLKKLSEAMIEAGNVEKLLASGLPALRAERAPVLAGGLAIMRGIVKELGINKILPAAGALRLGVLYDLLGRSQAHDTRATTVNQFMIRYNIDRPQAERVAQLTENIFTSIKPGADEQARILLRWAALLSEIGFAISHGDYHKHTAYVLEHADMPGFSNRDQHLLALLTLGQRGNLRKIRAELDDPTFRAQLFALRLASLLYHGRRAIDLPAWQIIWGNRASLSIPIDWLEAHPLSAYLLQTEVHLWGQVGIELRLRET